MKILALLVIATVVIAVSADKPTGPRRRRPASSLEADSSSVLMRSAFNGNRYRPAAAGKPTRQRGDIAESCRLEPGCDWDCGSEFCTCRCKVNEQLLNARYSPPRLSPR